MHAFVLLFASVVCCCREIKCVYFLRLVCVRQIQETKETCISFILLKTTFCPFKQQILVEMLKQTLCCMGLISQSENKHQMKENTGGSKQQLCGYMKQSDYVTFDNYRKRTYFLHIWRNGGKSRVATSPVILGKIYAFRIISYCPVLSVVNSHTYLQYTNNFNKDKAMDSFRTVYYAKWRPDCSHPQAST